MTKKIGRPPKARKQEMNIGFYVTRIQYFVIKQKAEKAGVTISDYMRQVSVNGQVKAKWTEEERRMVRTMIGIAMDVHRLVEAAEKEGATQTALYFARYRGIIDEIINTLCHDR